MCSLTSSELEIESLIAGPSCCRSCLILSSKGSFLAPAASGLSARGSVVRPPRTSIFRSAAARRILFALRRFQRLQTSSHRFPQFGPVGEILPASPLRVPPQHRAIGNRASAVIALAHEAPELGVDGDEVVPAVHRQQMRGAIRPDARQLAVAFEQALGTLRRIAE